MNKALSEAEVEQGRERLNGSPAAGRIVGRLCPPSVVCRPFLIRIGYLLLTNILFDKQLLHVERRKPLEAQEGPA